MRCPRAWAVAATLAGITACNLPRDAAGTLDRVKHGTMRVGVISNPPWVVDSAGSVGGVEGSIVNGLAAQLGATVQWVRRPESELLLALQKRDLDMVVGGLTDAVPWQQSVAFTRSYYTDTVVVGAPANGARPSEIKGDTVAVESGSETSSDVQSKGAHVILVDKLSPSNALVAAPTWRLSPISHMSTGIMLRQDRHVIAVPLGENAWLVQVERFLHAKGPSVGRMLRTVQQ